ncbi:MAG: DUF11 domain-containing protein [Solirubrobacterales bacterium]|nr:DUF11 domain-containing protein [Solirubrobacterales bacterium]
MRGDGGAASDDPEGTQMRGALIRRLVLSSIAVLGGLAALAPQALGAARPFEPRFSTNDTGDIEIVANTLLTCPDADPQCAAARAGTASGSALNNNNYVMQHVNADPAAPAAVFNSSSADLDLPAGATVLKAMLYYGGDSTGGSDGDDPPDAAQRDTVLLKAPGASAYQSLTALQVDDTSTSGNDFQGIVDVTDQVAGSGSGAYWVANVQAGTGRDRQAGWSLVVAYRDTSQPPRNLTIFDGYQVVNSGNPNITIPVSGFQTPPSGPVRTKLGFIAYEGDAGSSGDGARLNDTTLSDATNPATNFFNSAISHDGAPFTAKDPDYINQLGYDSILTGADGVLANDATSAEIHLRTGGETYFPGVVTFATELFAPSVAMQKSVEDLNGGQVEPGDTLRYTLTATNSGPDDANDVVITDPIPTGATFAPGSLDPGPPLGRFDAANNRAIFHVGTGASAERGGTLAAGGGSAQVSFDVTVDAVPSGTEITNASRADFFAETLGAPLSADSNAVTSTVAAPDLTLSKEPASFTAVGGATQDFTLTVTNAGDAPTDGSQVTVTDDVAGAPPGAFDSIESVGGVGWNCSPTTTPTPTPATIVCERATPAPLGAGDSYPPIQITAGVVGSPPAGEIANTASVAGGGDGDPTNNSGTNVGQATSRADLQLLKTADPTTALTGEQVTFGLRVRNGGPSAAQDVQLTDSDLADNFSVDSVTASQGTCTTDVQCDLGTLAAGEQATVTITATVTATGAEVVSAANTATVTSSTADPDPSNDGSTATVDVAPTADLSIAKSASPDPFDPTAPAHYTLSVNNDGPQAATNALVTDPLPDGFTFQAATPSQGSCDHSAADNTLTCQLGDLAAGADATITVDGTLAASTGGTSISNSARVDADTGDPRTADNTTTTTTPVIEVADLELLKTADDATPQPGATVTFTLRLTNHGPNGAENVEITDTLPAGLELVSAPGCATAAGEPTCGVGALAAGESRAFEITVRVADSLAGQQVTNTASASSDTPDPIAANGSDDATLEVGVSTPQPPPGPPAPPPGPPITPPPPAAADLAVTKRAIGDPLIGGRLRYEIRVENRGPAVASNVTVSDRLPRQLGLVSAKADRGNCTGQRTIDCTLGDLAVGDVATVNLTVSVRRAGRLTNRATVNSATPDPSATNNVARAGLNVRPARVRVRTRADRKAVPAGESVDYRITVRNRAPARPRDVRVCDRPGSGLAFVSAPHADFRNGKACWTIRHLARGEKRTFEVTLRVAAATSARTVTNHVRVSGASVRTRKARAGVRVLPVAGPPGGVTG